MRLTQIKVVFYKLEIRFKAANVAKITIESWRKNQDTSSRHHYGVQTEDVYGLNPRQGLRGIVINCHYLPTDNFEFNLKCVYV